MLWFMLGGLVIPVAVACAALSRRLPAIREDFPWFWVVFPITCMAIARVVGTAVLPPTIHRPESGTYSSRDLVPIDAFTMVNVGSGILAVVAVVGTGLSVWAWRRNRV